MKAFNTTATDSIQGYFLSIRGVLYLYGENVVLLLDYCQLSWTKKKVAINVSQQNNFKPFFK